MNYLLNPRLNFHSKACITVGIMLLIGFFFPLIVPSYEEGMVQSKLFFINIELLSAPIPTTIAILLFTPLILGLLLLFFYNDPKHRKYILLAGIIPVIIVFFESKFMVLFSNMYETELRTSNTFAYTFYISALGFLLVLSSVFSLLSEKYSKLIITLLKTGVLLIGISLIAPNNGSIALLEPYELINLGANSKNNPNILTAFVRAI